MFIYLQTEGITAAYSNELDHSCTHCGTNNQSGTENTHHHIGRCLLLVDVNPHGSIDHDNTGKEAIGDTENEYEDNVSDVRVEVNTGQRPLIWGNVTK